MGEGIPLARWSRSLVEEIFGDREGEGRPVSTIDAGEALLARALTRSGVHRSDDVALDLFLSAFPDRWKILRWFSGVDSPGEALPAFLVLCCLAASDTIGSEANDYRERLREMMGWDVNIVDCAGLPQLWRRLQAALAASPPDRRLRPLILPDPRFRTQIGHAIELTFPSRQDGRRLKRDLEDGGLTDPNHPVAVMRWLSAKIGHYSTTFNETFADFQAEWRSGARALTDHRFWSGWRLVVESWRPILTQQPFLIVSDEWGRHQLVTAAGEPTTLRQVEAQAAGALRHLLGGGSPILLREADWGEYAWAGQGRAAAREARAALVREKSHSASILAQLDRYPVTDAPGWFMTTTVDLVPGAAGRASVADDDLIDVRFLGVPRVDGGRLARPSFPLKLLMTGPVGAVTVSGELSGKFETRRLRSEEWWLTPTEPVAGDLSVRIEAPGGEIGRLVSLRRSANTPDWQREPPKRFVADEVTTPPWAPTVAAPFSIGAFEEAPFQVSAVPQPGMADLVEYLAARPSALPLGGFLELLNALPQVEEIGRWSLLRILLEGGVVDPLRVRGWRGGAVLPRGPRAVLVPGDSEARLVFDGIVNEVMQSRIQGIARRSGLLVSTRTGLGGWSPTTLSVRGEATALATLSSELGLECEHLRRDLTGHTRPRDASPDANGANHSIRQEIRGEATRSLEERGVRLFLCRRETEDAAPVWLVQVEGHEPRYWGSRHLALLDACVVAGLEPGRLDSGRLTMTVVGAFLPLQVARWLRLANGVASGFIEGGHAYAMTPHLEPMLRGFLGLRAPAGDAVPALPPRRRGPGVASAGRGTVEIVAPWRWARDGRGAAR